MKVNRTMETTCSVTARGRCCSGMGKGPRESRIDRLLMIAARAAAGRGKSKTICRTDRSGVGRRYQLRGDQGGQGIFFAAEAGEQGGLFFGGEAIPDFDHFLGGADQDTGLGFGKFVGHGAGSLFRRGGKRKFAVSTQSVRRGFQSSLSAWRQSVASFGSGCWAPACCVVVCSGTCRLGKGRLGISCMVALLAKSVDRSGRSALSKKPWQDTGVKMTNRLLYLFVSTNGIV